MGTVWVSYGWTRRKPLENQGVSGAGKQDLKSETAVNSVHFCIIRFNSKSN